MEEVKQILFPVDLSETSPKIVPYVRMMQQKFSATVHLVFIARAFQHFGGIYVPNLSIQTLESELIKGATRRIEEFREYYFNDLPDVKTAVLAGDISETILEYVEKENIDMIVMGTHGRKGLDRAFFGSVAERVIKTAQVPVLVVNPYRIAK